MNPNIPLASYHHFPELLKLDVEIESPPDLSTFATPDPPLSPSLPCNDKHRGTRRRTWRVSPHLPLGRLTCISKTPSRYAGVRGDTRGYPAGYQPP